MGWIYGDVRMINQPINHSSLSQTCQSIFQSAYTAPAFYALQEDKTPAASKLVQPYSLFAIPQHGSPEPWCIHSAEHHLLLYMDPLSLIALHVILSRHSVIPLVAIVSGFPSPTVKCHYPRHVLGFPIPIIASSILLLSQQHLRYNDCMHGVRSLQPQSLVFCTLRVCIIDTWDVSSLTKVCFLNMPTRHTTGCFCPLVICRPFPSHIFLILMSIA